MRSIGIPENVELFRTFGREAAEALFFILVK